MMGNTTLKEEPLRSRNNAEFLTSKNAVSRLEKNDFPINLPPGNLSFYNHYYNYILASSKKNNGLPDQSTKLKKGFMKQLEKYCKNSTLHGLKYAGDPRLTYGERIFWFIFFLVAIGLASFFISNVYTRWKSSPVIISFSPFDTELSSIPFPAITICNMNQAKKTEAERVLREGSTVEKLLLDDCCNRNATFNNSKNINWKSMAEFLFKVGNNCEDILKLCLWGNERVNCSDIFKDDLTDEGLCCSFNRLSPEKIFRNWQEVNVLNQTNQSNIFDWDSEHGYEGNTNDDVIPRKPLGAGANMGLSVTLDVQADNYYCSSTSSTGFKVLLSSPMQPPSIADYGFYVSPGFESRITIQPSEIEATPTLRNIPIEKRQCYFFEEHPLLYFIKYTEKHCKLECQSITILEKCGCIPYYLPKNESTNLCPRNDFCTERTLDLIEKSSKLYTNITKENRVHCGCLPRCFKLDFYFAMSIAPLKVFRKTRYTDQFIRDNFAKVYFYFETTAYPKIRKMPLYNFTDLMAYTGGLLGFFIGFSFLSMVELLFHLIWLTWKEYVMKKKKIKPKVINRITPPPYPFVN